MIFQWRRMFVFGGEEEGDGLHRVDTMEARINRPRAPAKSLPPMEKSDCEALAFGKRSKRPFFGQTAIARVFNGLADASKMRRGDAKMRRAAHEPICGGAASAP
jgi:hypothetical protein